MNNQILAVHKAQQVLDSLTDIRPEYVGKRVVKVQEEPSPNTVLVALDDDMEVRFVGLLAKTILRSAQYDEQSEIAMSNRNVRT